MSKAEELGCDEVLLPMTVFDQYGTAQKYVKSVQAKVSQLEAELAAEREKVRELERAYGMLEVYGVPRQRAKSVDNGIEVLASRHNKEIHALNAVAAASQLSEQRLREALLWLCGRCEEQGFYSPTRQKIVIDALSTPTDTSAMDAHVEPWKKYAESEDK